MRGLQVIAAGKDAEESRRVLYRRRLSVECSVIGEDVRADREHFPLFGRRDFITHVLIAGKSRAQQVFAAIFLPLLRFSGDNGCDNGADVPGIDRYLISESSAYIG